LQDIVGPYGNFILPKDEISIGTNYILQIKNLLGSGSFGEIYKGKNIPLNFDLAIKCESSQRKHRQLKYESTVLNYLQGDRYPPPIGIPALYDFLTSENFSFMMMELLGPSLEDLFDICHNKFSLKTILSLGDQMLSRIEFLHSRNLIHRDIKPDNFLMGLYKNKSIVHICDFGLCKKYKDKNGKHIPFKDRKSLVGTSRYASIYSHLGYELSRRDDLESLGYMLIYFLKGSLPWEYVKGLNNSEKIRKIYQIKKNYNLAELCQGIPEEFKLFLNYVKSLTFLKEPDYNYCFSLFYGIFKKMKIINDGIFSWYQEKNKENPNKKKEFYNRLWNNKYFDNKISGTSIFKNNNEENNTFNNKSNIISNIKKSNSCFLNIHNSFYLLDSLFYLSHFSHLALYNIHLMNKIQLQLKKNKEKK